MLLLMRRAGETIRINEKITLQIKEIHPSAVTFILEGLSDELGGADEGEVQEINKKEKNI